MTFYDISKEIYNCKKCELYKTRNKPVIGQGGDNAKILFIGEAPGKFEDEKGVPFVGRSGKLLDEYLNEIGLDKNKDIYISNILKCRPPNNRNPKPEEQEACIKYLREQYKILKPKVIICLGRIAAQRIIKPDFKITKEHGKWFLKKGAYFMATFHPSALLRNPANKVLATEDFKKIKEKILELKILEDE